MATDHDPLDPRLREAIAGLRDREPASDLWPGVARRIAPRRPGTLQLPWPVAAAAALALVAGSALVTWQLLPPSEPGSPVATTPVVPNGGASVLPAGFERATTTLGTAISQLEDAFAEVAPTLDAEARTAILTSIRSLDAAIADARARTGASPGDVDAARYLTRTMQRKLRVLQTATSLTASAS
jgi:type VI protein secretion system component VasF